MLHFFSADLKTRIKGNLSITIMLLLTLFLTFRALSLGSDISNSDALRWHRRSVNFLNALKTGDLRSTYQRYHPGVTLMWIGAASDQILSKYQSMFSGEVQSYGNADFYPIAHGFSKLVLVFVLAGIFVYQLVLVKHLFGRRTMILFGGFVAVEPYLVGINRWFHLSSLESFLAFAAILPLLAYMKNSKKSFLVQSAVFLGLGILTKMTVLITALFIFVLLLWLLFTKKLNIKGLVLYCFVSLLTIFTFFPALWVDSFWVIKSMYTALSSAVTDDPRGESFSGLQKIFYYPVILILKSSPLLTTLGMYSFVATFRKKETVNKIVAVYFLFTMILLAFTDQKIDRYVVALMLPLILIMSSVISQLRKSYIYGIVLVHFAFFIYTTFNYYPIYSAYISPFAGFSRVLSVGFYDNSGEYYPDAARYLNTKGRDTKVYIQNNVDSFLPYYKGKVTDDVAVADYVVFGLDSDRKTFPIICGCSIEKKFGNKIYRPVVVYKCISNELAFADKICKSIDTRN